MFLAPLSALGGGGSGSFFHSKFINCPLKYCDIQKQDEFKHLRVPAFKKQTDSQIRNEGRKLDFAHIFLVDRLGHDKNYWVFFWQNILLFQRNKQITKFC